MDRSEARGERLQPRVGDLSCMVVALVIGGMASDATGVATTSYSELNDIIGLTAIASLWWRRGAPLSVAFVTFLAAAASPLAGGAAIVGVYTIASLVRTRPSRAVAGLYLLYLLTGAISATVFPDEEIGAVAGGLAAIVLTVAAYGWGLASRSRGELVEALAERAARAEADQHDREVAARRAERVRIAAEMHDVLAHRLSLLSLHAGAVELRPTAPVEELAEAVGVIRSTAHLALEDLRNVIGVLRDEPAGDLAPPPTFEDIGPLVAECRAAGMTIELAGVVEEPARVSASLGRDAYRIVREGLTNARKHAPAQPVQLVVAGRAGEGLRVDLVNPVCASAGASTVPIPGAGTGLIGLAERTERAGGTLVAELESTDGTIRHHLRAWLPWP